MNNEQLTKTYMIQTAINMLPPSIIRDLSNDFEFIEKYGLIADFAVFFGEPKISFSGSRFYDAVLKAFSDTEYVELIDKEGSVWNLCLINSNGELPKLKLIKGDMQVILNDFAMLSPNSAIRLKHLENIQKIVNLPMEKYTYWHGIFSNRTLNYEEVETFIKDYHNTPVEVSKSIRDVLKSGHFTISSLVPDSRRYYERLIGEFNGSQSIEHYAKSNGRLLFENLSNWNSYDGFLFSIMLSSHSFLTKEIPIDKMDKEECIKAFNFIYLNGDVISRLGAIEIGLRIISSIPDIEPIIISMVNWFIENRDGALNNSCELISALFMLVDAEFSRMRFFVKEPPYYRRLAALTHASLLYRQIDNSGIDIRSFCEWAISSSQVQFHLQTYSDMRIEPRWSPELATASQLKEEFIGRIAFAALNNKKNIKTGNLHDFLFNLENGIVSLCSFPYSYFPGPLEGTEQLSKTLPPYISEMIEKQLSGDNITAKSYITLVNSALIYPVDQRHVELAATALKLSRYHLNELEDKSQLRSILNGLATVASITRSYELADELRILIRKYMRDSQYTLSIKDVFSICLIVASSRKELDAWCDFVGKWLAELAFDDIKDDESEVFHSLLRCLNHIVPALWSTCGRADTALAAFNERNG